jgi:hypothetical protein
MEAGGTSDGVVNPIHEFTTRSPMTYPHGAAEIRSRVEMRTRVNRGTLI